MTHINGSDEVRYARRCRPWHTTFLGVASCGGSRWSVGMTQTDQSAEITFKGIFDSIPISIWVEDFSAVVSALDCLRDQGIVDIGGYLLDHPGETERLVQMIRVLDINQASLGLYGATNKEELFASLDILFTPQSLESFRKELVAVAENREVFTAEVESRKLGGERLDLLISVVPAIPGGGWGQVLVTATDITERKRAEEQLVRSREQYKDLVEKAGIAIGIDRDDGSLRYINDQGAEMFGYSQKEMQSFTHRDLVHPDDFARVSKIHAGRLAGRTVPSRYEFRAVCKDGSAIWLEIEATSLEEDGKVVGTRSYLWDISKRKQLETELRESRASFAAIVDQNIDGITVVDADGVIRFANPAACTFLETSLEKLVGSRCDWTAHDGNGDDLEVRRPNGGLGIAELGSIETTWDGQSARLVVLRDVTERRRLEKDLLQAQKMEAIGRLAGGVAHEFNNLLQAMLSTAEARLAGDVGGAGTEFLRELEPLILRGRSQIRQLLLFSRREEPVLEPLGLNRVLRENMAMLERLVAENIILKLQLDDRNLQVRGDQGQLGQVLVNLVVNAADALPKGGRITVRSGMRPGGTCPAEPAGQVWFEVEDSGIGIPKDVRDRIFEPFFTTKERGLGTGLGLSVAHGIVSRHRGSIEVDSQVNRGTRVLVLLPEEQAGPNLAEVHREAAPGFVTGRGERVLLVEDEPTARSGLCDVLEMLGYTTVAVKDAEQALELHPTPVFDLLITDLMLPGLSGAALAEQLRVRWPDLGVIVISGYTEDRIADLVHNLKSARFMHKPFRMAELSFEIRAALDER